MFWVIFLLKSESSANISSTRLNYMMYYDCTIKSIWYAYNFVTIVDLIWTESPILPSGTPPQIMLPCISLSLKKLLSSYSTILQTYWRLFVLNISNFDSSVQNTISYSIIVQDRCPLRHWRRFVLFIRHMKGFRLAMWEFKTTVTRCSLALWTVPWDYLHLFNSSLISVAESPLFRLLIIAICLSSLFEVHFMPSRTFSKLKCSNFFQSSNVYIMLYSGILIFLFFQFSMGVIFFK